MTKELKPIDVSKYTVTESGNVIRTDNKDTLKNALERIVELEKENAELKILISSLVYEINQIWDISEMNDDLRMCAEKIDREVQLSKMAEDNRIVISSLGFAVVPPKPTLNVKEV